MTESPRDVAAVEMDPTALPANVPPDPVSSPEVMSMGPPMPWDLPASCSNGLPDGQESDIDCGGPDCHPCDFGRSCQGDSDCYAAKCDEGKCYEEHCFNGLEEYNESAIDCGGECKPCPVQLTGCPCASSPSLSALACGGRSGQRASVNADGSVVAFALCTGEGAVLDMWDPGRCSVARWTPAAGTEMVLADAQPRGISADGQIVLIQTGAPGLWSAAAGMTELPLQAALALSNDGLVVLGERVDPDNPLASLPALWTASNGVQTIDFGVLPQGVRGARALTLSGDASVIVGFLFDEAFLDPVAPQPLDLFRWTAAGGLVRTSARYNPDPRPRASVLSSTDGAWIIGGHDSDPDPRVTYNLAFRWTEALGVSELQTNDGFPFQGFIHGSSASGERLLTTQDARPELWQRERGFWSLYEALQGAGVSLDGWLLEEPLALSGDGHVVIGRAYCDGLPAIYRALVPE